MRSRLPAPGLLLVLALAACGDSTTLTGPEAEAAFVEAQSRAANGQTLRIRGTTSIDAADRPAIFVDGERVGEGPRSLLRSLEPEDIERIEVVKGCRAEGLLGDDGMGGIIFIYTTSRDAAEVELALDEERLAECEAHVRGRSEQPRDQRR